MPIARNKVVTLEYILRDGSGELLEQTEPDDPFLYIHGIGQIVPGLEQRLDGLDVGATFKVELTPEEGYGMPDPEGRFMVPKDALPPGQPVEEGTMLVGETEDGEAMPMRVVAVEDDHILVDANHPLAGETLRYEVKVLDIRDATAEELEHGHVHDGSEHEDDEEDEED